MLGLTGLAQPTDISIIANTYVTSQQEMLMVHPVRGMSCIKRTGRIYYVG
jgi:hypothetical protein